LGPLPLKISFNFRKHAFGSYFFCYEIIRVKRDRGEAAIEFICFNKWYEAKLRKKLRCNVSNIASRVCSCRVGSATFKPAQT
jgi:hypothetical protein